MIIKKTMVAAAEVSSVFEGGNLGGAGQLQWIHRTCHRRLRRRGWMRRSKVDRLMR